ncbi:hypothetical protein BDM02DRAFT_3113756 [Thelephora ganbajun]|uniref:Uncharacterized protein n=1 Tax=Thelephora ganbajun TaxID=370292 RepID=A0ACB6ZJ24_THEGA|nr:hypothetical protein BDM02DRAFT_3113756 [Thelephora ganbajun]
MAFQTERPDLQFFVASKPSNKTPLGKSTSTGNGKVVATHGSRRKCTLARVVSRPGSVSSHRGIMRLESIARTYIVAVQLGLPGEVGREPHSESGLGDIQPGSRNPRTTCAATQPQGLSRSHPSPLLPPMDISPICLLRIPFWVVKARKVKPKTGSSFFSLLFRHRGPLIRLEARTP